MPIFLFVYIVGSFGGALLVPIWVAIDPTLNVELNVLLETIGHIIIFFSPPYSALCALFMAKYFQYSLTDKGVTVTYLTGRKRTLLWDEIVHVQPIRLGNLSYLRIYTRSGDSVIWLPLFVRSEQHMDELIPRLVPEGHVARSLAHPAVAPVEANPTN